METLGDLLARDRRTDDVAVRVDGDPTVEYTHAEVVTTAWKTANFFSLRGVHRGSTVGVVDEPAVPSLLALFGAGQLGGIIRFDPPATVDARLLVGPGASVCRYDLSPGATRVAFHDVPDDPTVEAFGRSVWSENPTEPPERVPPDEPAISVDGESFTHRELIERAAPLVDALSPSDDVVVRGSLADAWTVVAGVLAPLWAGATVVFPDDATVGDVAVGGGDAPEPRTLPART